MHKKITFQERFRNFCIIIQYFFWSLGRTLQLRGTPVFVPPSYMALLLTAVASVCLNVYGFWMPWVMAITLIFWKILFVIIVFMNRGNIRLLGLQTLTGLFALELAFRLFAWVPTHFFGFHQSVINWIDLILFVWGWAATSAFFQEAFVVKVRGAILLALAFGTSSFLIQFLFLG